MIAAQIEVAPSEKSRPWPRIEFGPANGRGTESVYNPLGGTKPRCPVKSPVLHARQSAACVDFSGEVVPAGHSTALDGVGQKLARGHGWHNTDPVKEEKVPTGHGVHAVAAPPLENVPTGQGAPIASAVGHRKPGVQGKQTEAPAAEKVPPALQGEHEVILTAPSWAWKVPAGQRITTPLGQYAPIGQGAHELLRLSKNFPAEQNPQSVNAVLPNALTFPTGQLSFIALVLQKDPAGHGKHSVAPAPA